MKLSITIEYNSGEQATYIAQPPEWAKWEKSTGNIISQEVIYYKYNVTTTKTNMYGESVEGRNFADPVMLFALIELGSPESPTSLVFISNFNVNAADKDDVKFTATFVVSAFFVTLVFHHDSNDYRAFTSCCVKFVFHFVFLNF